MYSNRKNIIPNKTKKARSIIPTVNTTFGTPMHPNNDNITMNLVIREIKYINSAVNTDLGLGTPIIINSDDVTINMAICKIKYINSSITAKYPVKPNLRHL